EGLARVLQDDRQRVPAGPDFAAGTEADARASREVLLRRGCAAAARLRRAARQVRVRRPVVRAPGDVVLVSCYEPGHQPQGVASAIAFLRRAGFQPKAIDLAGEPLDDAARARLAAARFAAISVPMHTALVLGRRVGAHVRQANAGAHL